MKTRVEKREFKKIKYKYDTSKETICSLEEFFKVVGISINKFNKIKEKICLWQEINTKSNIRTAFTQKIKDYLEENDYIFLQKVLNTLYKFGFKYTQISKFLDGKISDKSVASNITGNKQKPYKIHIDKHLDEKNKENSSLKYFFRIYSTNSGDVIFLSSLKTTDTQNDKSKKPKLRKSKLFIKKDSHTHP